FIQEGLQDFTNALYYLSLYYELSGDKKVLGKMTEIANEHQLLGYDFDDIDFAANVFDQYRLYFVVGLLLLALILFGVLLYNFRHQQPLVIPAILEVIIICGLFLASNNILSEETGIIASDHTILRSAPSAAAEPVDMVGKGHRVVVLSQDKVWLKIVWQEQEAYLRRGRVRMI
ncbi:MAG: SH3 domain-containing protein, partial [Bacteroidota bacterium]